MAVKFYNLKRKVKNKALTTLNKSKMGQIFGILSPFCLLPSIIFI